MTQPLLPHKALDTHTAVLGKTGSGKTFAIKGSVEWLIEHGRRVCIIDPTGAWWGLRFGVDGRSPGLKVLILGGEHGDMPLPVRGGEAVARLVVEQGVSVVIDTSGMGVNERSLWFTEFATALFRLNRDPLHLVIDEAHLFAPQGKVPDPQTGKMLHAANTLMSGGRSRGIRGVLITQRPQKLHKDALTCADALVAMRVMHPLDRQAVKDWIDGCGDAKQGKEVLDSLANLEKGEGWVWWPEGKVLTRGRFPAIRTFDSSASPTGSSKHHTPKNGAEVDLGEIRKALAEAAAEAEANDPKRLRARIAELEKQARAAATVKPGPAAAIDPEQAEALRSDGRKAALSGFRPLVKAVEERAAALERLAKGLMSEAESARAMVGSLGTLMEGAAKVAAVPARGFIATPVPGRVAPLMRQVGAAPSAKAHEGVGNGHQKVLDAVAWFAAIGDQSPSRRAVGGVCGLDLTSGHGSRLVGECRSYGWIDYPRDGCVSLSDLGRTLANHPGAMPTLAVLHERWLAYCSSGQAKVLRAVIDLGRGESVSRSVLGEAIGLDLESGHGSRLVGELRSLGVIDYPGKGYIAGSALLFPEGLA